MHCNGLFKTYKVTTNQQTNRLLSLEILFKEDKDKAMTVKI